MTSSCAVYFAGPEQPGRLRHLLAERIAATPAGGYIHWVTYYFRDRQLAQALIDAHQRGVTVTICLAARPRTADANDAVINMLTAAPGDGLRRISLPGLPAPAGRSLGMQLHEKIYCFSHPMPCAFIGSFNPSGDVPEERPDIITEIGDQDRGYNYLVALTEPRLVAVLTEHAQRMYQHPPTLTGALLHRLSHRANLCVKADHTHLYFWPRQRGQPLIDLLGQFGRGAVVRIAASHISAGPAIHAMIALARRGARLDILASASLRRISHKTEQQLRGAGIGIRRIGNKSTMPMHLKFMLVAYRQQRWSVFGSVNWTWPSLWLNYEVAAISRDPELYAAFAHIWAVLQDKE